MNDLLSYKTKMTGMPQQKLRRWAEALRQSDRLLVKTQQAVCDEVVTFRHL